MPNTPAVNRVDSPEMEEDNDQRTPPDTTRLGDEYDDRVEVIMSMIMYNVPLRY